MFFKLVVFLALTVPFASAAAVPVEYKIVTPDMLPSIAATSNFLITSGLYGTHLNVAHDILDDGNPVIAYNAGETTFALNSQVGVNPLFILRSLTFI